MHERLAPPAETQDPTTRLVPPSESEGGEHLADKEVQSEGAHGMPIGARLGLDTNHAKYVVGDPAVVAGSPSSPERLLVAW